MNSQWHLDDIKPLQKYFEFAEANYDLYRIMIFGKGGITASRQLHQNIADNVQKLLEDEIAATGAEAVVPVMFIANHLAGALLATIFWSLFKHPYKFPLAITFSIYGYHFRKANELHVVGA